jgi:hypothetical protein
MNFLRQSTAVDIAIGPFIDDDGITPATGLSITQAETRLKKNNGAWAQVNDATTATHEEEGWYEKELDATDTNTVGILIVAVYISGNLAFWKEFQVVEEAVYDQLFAASALGYIANAPVNVAQFGGSNLTSAAGIPAVNATQFAGQTITAGAGVTLPSSVASPTNITAGTITTVTNLTNAPTAGDFTATMKTSIGTAVAASAVASVTGNVGGDVTGSVGSLAAQAKTDVADGVWDAPLANHQDADSTGEALGDAGGSGTPPTVGEIADEVQTRTIAAVTVVNGLAANVITAAATAADFTTEIQSGLATAAELAKVPKSDSNVVFNATAAAQFQSEATDALNAYDPPTRAEATSDANSILAILGTPAGASLAADLLAIDNFVDGLEGTLADGTIGLAAIEALVDELESRLTSARAGYLDNLSAGAVALQASVDDLEGRLTSALAIQLAAHSLGVGRMVVDTGSSTTAVIFKTVNGATASAVNDFYNGRHIVFTSGALMLQACSISDYVGATKTATVPALTGAPAEDVTAVIV